MSSYFGQFKIFNPISGDLPNTPFSILPAIAIRARNILKSRTVDQIESVAEAIDYAIYSYFNEIKENEIYRLKKILLEPRRWKNEDDLEYQEALQFFDWDGGSEANGRWLFKEIMEDSLEISTPNNTSEVEALKDLGEWWESILEGFPDGKNYEIFAVLSLWQLADSMKWLKYKRSEAMKVLDEATVKLFAEIEANLNLSGIKDIFGNEKEQNLSLAGESALNAMDAVCYAEHLFSLEREIASVKEKQKIEHQLEEKKRRLMVSEKLNIARHQKRNEAMNFVTNEWVKDPNKFASAEKAGIYFSESIRKVGFEYEPRTVAEWIRKYAKKIGIRFR